MHVRHATTTSEIRISEIRKRKSLNTYAEVRIICGCNSEEALDAE